MVGKIIFGVAVILTFGLYCCVRVGGQADRQMEEMLQKKRKDQENGDVYKRQVIWYSNS